MGADFSQFHQVFFDESHDLINQAEEILVKIELSQMSDDDINTIFRCAHSIKSNSAMFGFNDISQFAHTMEDYLDRVRNHEKHLTSESVEILLKSLDCLRSLIASKQNKTDMDITQVKKLEADIQIMITSDPQTSPIQSEESMPFVTWDKKKEFSSIRVATEKVDDLINMVGELVITQSMLTEVSKDFDMSRMVELKEGLLHLESNCRKLQDSIMRIRMLPISTLFDRFPRMVREFCHSFDKKVILEIKGENTELDKSLIEKLSDPLVHLVRNALDHGIEDVATRKLANKPEHGTLTLNAFHQGSNVHVEISDDGRGLDLEKIHLKAQEKGLISTTEALSQREIQDFIFLPGFSTAEKVTDISGRGVGMDVVRKNISAMGGHIQVHSEKGKGTKFSIALPLTLSIIDGQLIRVGTQVYIMPLINMLETIQIKPENVHKITQETEIYSTRDQFIPIIRLYELFSLPVVDQTLEHQFLVIVEVEKKLYGILINELLELQQVVIKNMEKNYHAIDGVSGATILGDGTVSFILDINSIVQIFNKKHQISNSALMALKTVA